MKYFKSVQQVSYATGLWTVKCISTILTNIWKIMIPKKI